MEFTIDFNKQYSCWEGSSRFTKLMYIVMNMQKYQNYDYLEAYLKEHPSELNAQNKEKMTALMVGIASYGSGSTLKAIQILIDAGCSLNDKDDYGYTPLIISCRLSGNDSHIEIVKMLIDAGCDLNEKDSNKETALMHACSNNNIEIVKLLIKGECDLDITSIDGWNGLTSVCLFSQCTLAKILIDAHYDWYVNDLEEDDICMSKTEYTSKILLRNKFVVTESEIYNLAMGRDILMDAENNIND